MMMKELLGEEGERVRDAMPAGTKEGREKEGKWRRGFGLEKEGTRDESWRAGIYSYY